MVERAVAEMQELKAAKQKLMEERDRDSAALKTLNTEITARYATMAWPCTTPTRMAKQHVAHQNHGHEGTTAGPISSLPVALLLSK
jgi:cytochrome c556